MACCSVGVLMLSNRECAIDIYMSLQCIYIGERTIDRCKSTCIAGCYVRACILYYRYFETTILYIYNCWAQERTMNRIIGRVDEAGYPAQRAPPRRRRRNVPKAKFHLVAQPDALLTLWDERERERTRRTLGRDAALYPGAAHYICVCVCIIYARHTHTLLLCKGNWVIRATQNPRWCATDI